MSVDYIKEFDNWNKKKKSLDKHVSGEDFFVLEGEVWWSSLGVNIAQEIDGKNQSFERPVLILKKFSDSLALALPITSKIINNECFMPIKHGDIIGSLALLHMRSISINRCLRLETRLNQKKFLEIITRFIGVFQSIPKIPSDH